VKIFIRKLDN